MSIGAKWNSYNYRLAHGPKFAPTRSLWLQISFRRGRRPPIIFARIIRPYNFIPDSFHTGVNGWGATSENRSKIGDFASTRSLLSKISGTRGRPPPIIFALLVWPMNALQLCRWQFSHKKTLQHTFFKRTAILHENRPFCVFGIPFGGLRGNVRRSS